MAHFTSGTSLLDPRYHLSMHQNHALPSARQNLGKNIPSTRFADDRRTPPSVHPSQSRHRPSILDRHTHDHPATDVAYRDAVDGLATRRHGQKHDLRLCGHLPRTDTEHKSVDRQLQLAAADLSGHRHHLHRAEHGHFAYRNLAVAAHPVKPSPIHV